MKICDCWCTEASAFSNPIGYAEAVAVTTIPSDAAEKSQHLFSRAEADAVNGKSLCGIHYIMNWDEASSNKNIRWKHALACRWHERNEPSRADKICRKCTGIAADKVAEGMKNEDMY